MCMRIESIDDSCGLEWSECESRPRGTVAFTMMTRRYARRLSRAHWFRHAMNHMHLRRELADYVSTLRVQDEPEPEEEPVFSILLI
jgi:hypothetical protein